MSKKSRSLLYITGGIIGLIILLFALKWILFGPYTSRIPELPESHNLSEQLTDQISKAKAKARWNPSADNLGGLGLIYHSSANYEQAAECYKLAIEREESQWIWIYYLAYLNLEMGNSEDMVAYFNQVIKKHPEISLAWYYSGEGYLNLRNYKEAERYFDKIVTEPNSNIPGIPSSREDHFPLGIYASYQLANIYMNTDRLDLAESSLKEIVLANRTFGPAYRLLGTVYRMKGDEDLSEQYVARANDLMIFSPPVDALVDRLALESRSDLYLLKKIDEAINSIHSEWALELIGHGIQYIPANKYLLSKAIKTYLWMDMKEQALSYTDEHMSLSQNDFNELFNMAMSFYNKEEYGVAIRYFLKALVLKSDDNEILKNLAICYWHNGQEDISMEKFEEIIEMNPNNMEVLAEVTDVMIFELGESKKSTSYLNILNHFLPSNPKVQKMSARKAEQKGETIEAIALYEASLEGDPEDITTLKNLGILLTGQKQWDKSIRHYRASLALYPNDPYFLERLGTLLIVCPDPSLRNVDEGRVYAERAYLNTTSAILTKISSGRNLALAHAMQGDKQNAIRVIDMTIQLAKDENFSPEYVAELEQMSAQFQAMKEGAVVLTQ